MVYQRPLPESWLELLSDVQDFVDPPVNDTNGNLIAWDPTRHAWSER